MNVWICGNEGLRDFLKCFQWPLGIFNAACKRGEGEGDQVRKGKGKGMKWARVDRQHLVSTQLVSEGMPDTCVLESGNRRNSSGPISPDRSGPSILSFHLRAPKQCIFSEKLHVSVSSQVFTLSFYFRNLVKFFINRGRYHKVELN